MKNYDILQRVRNGETLEDISQDLRMSLIAVREVYYAKCKEARAHTNPENHLHTGHRHEDHYWTLDRKKEAIDYYCDKGGKALAKREGWLTPKSATAQVSKWRKETKYTRLSTARKPCVPEKWTRELTSELFTDWKEGKHWTFMCEKYKLKDRPSFEATKAKLGRRHPDLRVTRNG